MEEQEPAEPCDSYADWPGDWKSWVEANLKYAKYWREHLHAFVHCRDCVACGLCYKCGFRERHKIHQ